MINNYNDAYKEYYDKLRKNTQGEQSENNKLISTKDYIYPSTMNVNKYIYNKGSYRGKSNKKRFKYIDGLILRLIISCVLLLGIFTVKTLPNKEAKEIYNICKYAISNNIDYEELISDVEIIGVNYSEIKNNFQEKYNYVRKQISKLNFHDINNEL